VTIFGSQPRDQSLDQSRSDALFRRDCIQSYKFRKLDLIRLLNPKSREALLFTKKLMAYLNVRTPNQPNRTSN
jgi:hypothetical protein